MDQNARQQIIDRLKEANNVLITVSNNPSVDQLAACIGITLVLNHMNKHATAVFSGDIPSTIEFLKPDETIEKNTDSLRDFIIALDKSKADKLRYKVEDKIVKIFITPYRTSLSDKDLDFSQGDFNVDAVLALGVHERTELDKAIVAHGRILHDATVISVNNKDQGNLGAINWVDLNSSSLSEMLAMLAKGLSPEAIDAQMATAFMTGIVAETDRFSNTKTSPQTMSLASELMSAGANQQLIASKLDETKPVPLSEGSATDTESDDGTGLLQISHQDTDKPAEDKPEPPLEIPQEPVKEEPEEKILPQPDLENVDEGPKEEVEDKPVLLGKTPDTMLNPPIMSHSSAIGESADKNIPAPSSLSPTTPPNSSSSMTWEPPALGGQLTANSQPEHMQTEPSTDPLSVPSLDSVSQSNPPLLSRQPSATPVDIGNTDLKTPSASEGPPVNSPVSPSESASPSNEVKEETLDEAREAVDEAIAEQAPTQPLAPIAGLGAQPVNLNLGNNSPSTPPVDSPQNAQPYVNPSFAPSVPPASPIGAPPDNNGVNPNIPTSLLPPSQPTDPTASSGSPTAPPPVPPPFNPAP